MISNGSADTGEQERSPWTQPGFIASAVVVVLIVVLGLILTVTERIEGRRTGPQQRRHRRPSSSGPAQAPGAAERLRPPEGRPDGSRDARRRRRGSSRDRGGADRVRRRSGPPRCATAFLGASPTRPTGALFAMLNIQAAMGEFARAAGRYRSARSCACSRRARAGHAREGAPAKAPVADKGTTSPGRPGRRLQHRPLRTRHGRDRRRVRLVIGRTSLATYTASRHSDGRTATGSSCSRRTGRRSTRFSRSRTSPPTSRGRVS